MNLDRNDNDFSIIRRNMRGEIINVKIHAYINFYSLNQKLLYSYLYLGRKYQINAAKTNFP